jgi:ABC-type Mn2+/Zn2+ transport system permease subunit
VIFNIKSKIKNGYRKRRVNTALAVTIGSICISIGILLSKQTHLKSIPFAIILLVLAYSLIPTISGFHKFYLIFKDRDKH